MLKIKLIFIISLFAFIGHTQNWLPINPADTYHYAIDTVDYPSHTIWVDSVEQKNDRTIYYLNRIAGPCDTCVWLDTFWRKKSHSSFINWLPFPIIWMKNQPQFLQRKIEVLANGDIWFKDNGSYLLKLNPKPNEVWFLDSVNIIAIRLSHTNNRKVLGIVDSVKVYTISGGDSILLSKKHGLIYIPDFSNYKNHFRLIGIENKALGAQLPKTIDFFDFNIDDWFRYLIETHGPEYQIYISENYKITGKSSFYDSIVYQKDGFRTELLTGIYGKYDTQLFNTPLIYYYNKLGNSGFTSVPYYIFNNQIIQKSGDYYIANLIRDSNNKYNLTLAGLTVKRTNYYDYLNFRIYINPSGEKTDFLVPGDIGEYYFFKENLGLFLKKWTTHFEHYGSTQLLGYIKDGVQWGYVIPWNIVQIAENIEEVPSIYPNPARDLIKTDFPTNQIQEVRIVDIMGKEVYTSKQINSNEINISNLSSGHYIFEFKTKNNTYRKKFIKQ